MAVHDLFSKRQMRLRGEVPDVYTYDYLPKPLRVQLIQIVEAGIGDGGYSCSDSLYRGLCKSLCHEYGEFSLTSRRGCSAWEAMVDHILQAHPHRVLDAIELCLRAMDRIVRHDEEFDTSVTADDAIAEVNYRFREHGVGYEFISGEIIRVDSQILHAEAVTPALALLVAPEYAGANDEFLAAHEHYCTLGELLSPAVD